jgi:hypothetical protein
MTRILTLNSENVGHLHVFNLQYLHYYPPLMTLFINVPVFTHVHKTVKRKYYLRHFYLTICLHGT